MHYDAQGRLHRDDGKAVEYPSGNGYYFFDGVRVPEKVVLEPETLGRNDIAGERNAEVRRVMVGRLGIERVCQMFHAISVDNQGDYELLVLDLDDGRKRPYLKMKNPSIGVYHLEGVEPSIRTIQAALNWRNHLSTDMIDDEYGADWQQQGDVILRPHGARRFKSHPTLLT